MSDLKHVVVTGGAGYIGSLLTAELLRSGYQVTVLDSLLYGGESLITFMSHPNFHFTKTNVLEARSLRDGLPRNWPKPLTVFHLAGIAGFPACQAVGKQAAWRYNVDATKQVFEQSDSLNVEKIIYASTYSVYALSESGGAVTEESALNPQSLYAETKLAAEQFVASSGGVVFRLPTLYGLSPRTRFDLLINQFALDAFLKRELMIYQRGYARSFVHVLDVARGLLLGMQAGAGEVFNLGSEKDCYTKDEIVNFILKRLPETIVLHKNLTFGGDERDLPPISFDKIRRELGFEAKLTVDDGVRELVNALRFGLISNPRDMQYRNAHFIIQ